MSEPGNGKPRAFRDKEGRLWVVAVTVGGLKRVKALTGEDVGKMSVPELAEMAGHPVRLADALYALCKPEADRLGVGDAAFGEALAGDAIESAADALWGAVADFFPTKGRALMLALLERGKAERDRARGEVMGRLTSSPPATPSPGTSESTPTPGPTGS